MLGYVHIFAPSITPCGLREDKFLDSFALAFANFSSMRTSEPLQRSHHKNAMLSYANMLEA